MADDIASLGFAIDSKPMLDAASAADRLSASASKLEKSHTLASTQTQRLAKEQQLAVASSRAVTLSQAELGDKIDLLNKATNNAYNSLSTRSFFRLLAREASLAGGPLSQMIGHFGLLNVGGQRLGIGLTAGTIGISAIAAAAYKSVEAFIELEAHQATVASALIATKGASGQSVASLEALTQQLGKFGTQGVADIRAAELELLKFKAVGADSFASVLRIAQGVANTGFADMKSAASAVAKAIEEPAKANEHLKETGLSLSVAQQRVIYDLAATGQRAQATGIILRALGDQQAGINAKASDTLSAAFGRVANASLNMLEVWGRSIATGLRLKDIMNGIADAGDRAAKPVDPLAAIDQNISIARGTLSEGSTRGGSSTAQGRRRAEAELNKLLEQRAKLEDEIRRADNSGIDQLTASRQAAAVAERAAKKAVDDMIRSLELEGKTAGMSALQREVYNKAVAVGVLGRKEEADIRAVINENMSKDFTRQATDQIKTQTAAQQVEIATLGMSTAAATTYRTEQELLTRAQIANTVLSPERIAAIKREAVILGEVTQANERLKQSAEIGGTFLSGFATDLSHGVAATDALKNALTRLSDTLIDMASRQLVKAALGGLAGGFSFGGSSSVAPTTLTGADASLNASIFPGFGTGHIGAIIGRSSSGTRYIHPDYFDNAPRFHGGGKLGRGEVPFIGKEGEEIGWPAQLAQKYGGGDQYEFHVHIDGAAATSDPQAVDANARAMREQFEMLIDSRIMRQKRARGLLS